MDRVKEYLEEIKSRLIAYAEAASRTSKCAQYKKVVSQLEMEIKRLKHKISIAQVLTHSPNHLLTHSPNHLLTQCVFDRLARAPWNTTSAYVRSRGYRDDKVLTVTHLLTHSPNHLLTHSLTHSRVRW